MIEWIISILGALGITNVVTFVLTKRKYNTEVDSQQLENVNRSFELYKRTMEDTLEAQKRMMEATISAQNEKIAVLQKDYDTLRGQYDQLQQTLIKLLMSNNLTEVKDKLMPLSNN